MRSMRRFGPLFLWALGAFAFAAAPARANLLPFLTSTSPGTPGDTTFDYSVSLSNDERIDASGTGNTAFFTIYDFAGYVDGLAVAPTGWSVSVQDVGVTPVGVTVPDDPNIVDLTFTYVGGSTVVGTGQTFTGFSAESTFSGINTMGYFSQQSTKNVGANAGGRDFGAGPEAVPMELATPEPSSLLLLGAGLALFAIKGRRHLSAAIG